jgi:uncharacterized iron-regulated membrane protein
MAEPSSLNAALRWMHRWTGLTLGAIFVIVGLSGTLLLFQPQFFRWAHGDLIPPGLSQEIGSVDRWVANARKAVPDLHEIDAIWIPQHEHNVSDAGMLIFGGREPGGLGNLGLAAVLVAPQTGDVLGVVDVDRSPAYAPLFLHGSLWTGDFGRFLVGLTAVGGCFLAIVGVYLWWPRRGQLTSKLSARPARKLKSAAPLHDWLGGWLFALLLMLSFTGLYLAQSSWVEPLLRALPSTPVPQASSAASACGPAITLDGAIARATAMVPGSRWTTLEPSHDSPDLWEILLRTGEPSGVHAETHVIANLECGTVEIEATPATRSAREAAQLWMMDLHEGSFAGLPGEAFIALLGLAPLVFLWSGVIIWLRRRAHARRVTGQVSRSASMS